jgi:hypothetical protein
MMSRSVSGRPRPPYSTGHVSPIQPLRATLRGELEGELPQFLVLAEVVVERPLGWQLGIEEGLDLFAPGIFLGREVEVHLLSPPVPH